MPYSPKVLDLFCGAGGMSLGFKNAGCEILGGIDNEDWPMKTHHRNFPARMIHPPESDIRDVHPGSLGLPRDMVDILIGGPPCQGFSQVGLAKIRSLGQERERDKKNRLYKEFIRFVEYFHPPFFVVENVQGMKTFKKHSFLDKILQELSFGPNSTGYSNHVRYEVESRVLCARDYGVPQVRNRLFIIGRRKDLQHLEIVFPTPLDTIVTLKDAIDDLPVLRAPVLNARVKGSLMNGGIHQHDAPKQYRTKWRNEYQRLMRANSNQVVLNHVCRGHNVHDLKIFSMLKPGQKYMDLPPKLRRYRDDIFDDKYRRLRPDHPCWTLTAHMQKDCLAYIHPSQKRSLSAREAARIQSFPDSFIFEGPLTKLFRMIGNAVPPLLAEQIATPLVRQLQKQQEISENEFATGS